MSEHGNNTGWIAAIFGGIVGLATVLKAIPRLCSSCMTAFRQIIRFNDAVPAVLTLPDTLKRHDERFDYQDAVLGKILEEIKTIKDAQDERMVRRVQNL